MAYLSRASSAKTHFTEGDQIPAFINELPKENTEAFLTELDSEDEEEEEAVGKFDSLPIYSYIVTLGTRLCLLFTLATPQFFTIQPATDIFFCSCL